MCAEKREKNRGKIKGKRGKIMSCKVFTVVLGLIKKKIKKKSMYCSSHENEALQKQEVPPQHSCAVG